MSRVHDQNARIRVLAREAKTLLRDLLLEDEAATRRYAAVFTDATVVGLMRCQHVVAVEQEYASWAEMLQAATSSD